jgi:hypothetical protein
LLLLSVFLLAPDLPRLARFFLLHRTAEPSPRPELFSTRRANRLAFAVQVGFGLWMLATHGYQDWRAWVARQETKSVLYGIWEVDQLSIDGALRPPLPADRERWRRAIFEGYPYMMFQRFDASSAWFGFQVDPGAKKVVFTKLDDKAWKAELAFAFPAQDQLTLDGAMDGRQIHMQLTRSGPEKLRLLARGFHWISEEPFNR